MDKVLTSEGMEFKLGSPAPTQEDRSTGMSITLALGEWRTGSMPELAGQPV